MVRHLVSILGITGVATEVATGEVYAGNTGVDAGDHWTRRECNELAEQAPKTDSMLLANNRHK